MSFLRDLATGSDNCTADGAGPSNAVGALVNTLLGASSKTREQLREVRFVCHRRDRIRTSRAGLHDTLLPHCHSQLPHVQQGGMHGGPQSMGPTPAQSAAAAMAHAEAFRAASGPLVRGWRLESEVMLPAMVGHLRAWH